MKKLFLLSFFLCVLNANSQNSFEYFGNGSKFYLQRNYEAASKQYAKALELEKIKQTLEKDYFYVLIDNLGMSYALTNNLQEAINTFEYGITIDAKYPMFYYNLACCYAEKNDLDRTISYLELAIKNKKNVIKGEFFPDPKKDDSFQKYLTNERFTNLFKSSTNNIKFDDLKLVESEIPQGYKLTNELHCISIQPHIFYTNPEIYESIIGKVKRKEAQNFISSNDKGSILYFEFEKDFKSQELLAGLLWGEDDKPTKRHPESFQVSGKFLIIWSFKEQSSIKIISENKVNSLID